MIYETGKEENHAKIICAVCKAAHFGLNYLSVILSMAEEIGSDEAREIDSRLSKEIEERKRAAEEYRKKQAGTQ
jgi:hypothetical protein